MHDGDDIPAKEAPLASDWPERFKVVIWLTNEHGRWSALAAEFDVVGMGDSQDAAMKNLHENLAVYLNSYIKEGASFAEAKRPIPLREKVRLWSQALRARLSSRGRNHHGSDRREVVRSHEDFAGQTLAHC